MVSTLLLDAAYEPMKVISWQRAITLLVLEKAELLEAYEEVVRSVSAVHALPSVVRMHRASKARRHGVKFSRANVYRRDEFRCQYCGAQPGLAKLTFDHVVPRARGGRTDWTNIVTACVTCNARKGARTPAEARMTLHRAPTRPGYMPAVTTREAEHASWHHYLPVGSA